MSLSEKPARLQSSHGEPGRMAARPATHGRAAGPRPGGRRHGYGDHKRASSHGRAAAVLAASDGGAGGPPCYQPHHHHHQHNYGGG